ncbi:uncharacterized protein BYT42DRAFT_579871 [Radiomyces spectabilis]|uniref:uncharacterized protein n=1 Tax=Radiomyces spectabilis TaxID=64574 RepID=UPI00221F6A2D|nr:uncharacterized protein BYT42DRAFT_579871 [Radiomyces spectabilis]KAI8371337.1 hypothetical protein BYT42DRAFT_579871 [Radiomyces spectabilis]
MAIARPSLSEHTRISSRTEIFESEEVIESNIVEQDAEKMDALMKSLMGGLVEEETAEPMATDSEHKDEDDGADAAAFAFRLFSSKPVSSISIREPEDTTDMLAKSVADQQKVDHDEDDPEFVALIQASAISYNDILDQSGWAYPAMRLPHRVLHISQEESPAAGTKEKKKRKSKKCRDFEKAVREGRIKLKPAMRNPATPGGWPGWPGHRTPCAIITDITSQLKRRKRGSGPNMRGRGAPRGGGRGAARGSGRGNGRGRPFQRH